jgi:GTP-binding protein
MANDVGIKIFRQEAKFIAGAARPDQLPKIALPQVAFVGKSNVGKSSLINTICRRKNLARVSHTPGRTQQINFFSIAEKLVIVDLPGYGFAKVPLKEKQNWEKLILYYLQNTPNLKLVNLLIDARRGIKDNDLKVIELLHSCNKQIQLVFTKTDKITLKEDFKLETKNYLASLGYLLCNVILSSSKNGLGAKELQLSLAQSVK